LHNKKELTKIVIAVKIQAEKYFLAHSYRNCIAILIKMIFLKWGYRKQNIEQGCRKIERNFPLDLFANVKQILVFSILADRTCKTLKLQNFFS